MYSQKNLAVRKLFYVVLAGLGSILFFELFSKITFQQAYREFIIGELAYYGWSKVNDLIVIPLSVTVFFFFYLFLSNYSKFKIPFSLLRNHLPNIGQRLKIRTGLWLEKIKAGTAPWLQKLTTKAGPLWEKFKARTESPLETLKAKTKLWLNKCKKGGIIQILQAVSQDDTMLPWFIPSVCFIALWIKGEGACPSLFFIPLIALISWMFVKRKILIVPSTFSLALLAAFLFFFLPLVPLVIWGRMFPILPSDNFITVLFTTQLVCTLCGVLYVTYTYCKYSNQNVHKKLFTLILLSQLFLPLLFLTLLPAKILGLDGVLYSYNTTVYLPVFVWLIVLLAYISLARRFFAYKISGNYSSLFSPLIFLAILTCAYYIYTVPPLISPDDYHFGEKLHGAAAYISRNLWPYMGHTPSHGPMVDDLASILSYFFFDGTSPTVALSTTYVEILLLLAAALSLQAFGKNTLLTVFVLFFMPRNSLYLYIIPIFALLLWVPDKKNYWKWLFTWTLLAAYTLFIIPPQGLIAVCATGVAAFVYFLFHLKSDIKYKIITLIPAFLLVVGVCFSPLLHVYIASISYVLENGVINQVAWGVPWAVDKSLTSWFQLVWILIPIISGFVCAKIYIGKRCFKEVLPFIVCSLFCFCLIPYTMGRVDPFSFTRTGKFSIFAFAGLMPIILFHYSKTTDYIRALIVISAVVCLLHPHFFNVRFGGQAVLGIRPLSADIIDTKIPGMGKAVIEEEHLNLVKRLHKVVEENSPPDTFFYNATNLSALYHYINKPVITSIAAPLNMPSKRQQTKAIAELESTHPVLVLLDVPEKPFLWKISWRNYYLYRYLMDKYQPFEENGMIFGKLRTNQAPATTEEIKLFSRAFSAQDLRLIPASWGRSIKSLAKAMQFVADIVLFPVEDGQRHVELDLSTLSVDQTKAGLLVFSLTTVNKKQENIPLRLSWRSITDESYTEDNSIYFIGNIGQHIVPLDAYPSWIYSNKIQTIKIEPVEENYPSYIVSDAKLFNRMVSPI